MKTLPFLFLLILIGCAKDTFLTDDNGAFKDSRDQHEYKWIRIGEQIWMAENLAWLPAVSPSSDGSNTTPYYYVQGYEGTNVTAAQASTNYTIYGVLYNWEAANTACPSGWHLPTDAQWTIVEDYLGPLPGKKMKSINEWSNGKGDNSSGLNAFPGGTRSNYGGFYSLGNDACFLSASEGDASYVWYH